MSAPDTKSKKPREIVFVLEWTVEATDVLDGIDGVREALTANGALEVIDVRVIDK